VLVVETARALHWRMRLLHLLLTVLRLLLPSLSMLLLLPPLQSHKSTNLLANLPSMHALCSPRHLCCL
jgi:hypothetical protein